MNKKMCLFLMSGIFLIFMISLISAGFTIHLNPRDNFNQKMPFAKITYTWEFTTNADCSGILYTNTSEFTMNEDGEGFIDFDLSTMTGIPNYICEYRTGALRKIHDAPTAVFSQIYAESLNLSGNLSVLGTSYFDGDLMPITTLTHDIGSGANRWRNIFGTNLSIDYIDAANNIIALGNITGDYFFGNGSQLTDISFAELDPLWTANTSSVARIGNCPAGQLVMNTTTSGVECLAPTLSESDPLWSANYTTFLPLTDNSMADTLHRHSELSASDGTPDQALVVDAVGNVGIGTTTPQNKLHVIGSINATDYYGSGQHLEDLELTNGLVLYMPFQAGQPLKDFSGEQNDGTNVGATWNYAGGYNGLGAYEFDGDDDKITVPEDASFNFSYQDFSVSAWIKPLQKTTDGYIFSKGNVESSEDGYSLYYESSDSKIYLLIRGGATIGFGADPTVLNFGNWHHYVLVYDNSTITATLYRNGVQAIQDTLSAVGRDSTNNNLYIGSLGGGAKFFNGSIDEVKVYNRSLSAEEVKRLYEQRNTEPYFDGSPLFLDHNNDRVGIGTGSPSFPLDVTTGGADDIVAEFTSLDDAAAIKITDPTNSFQLESYIDSFRIRDVNDNVHRLVIDGGGNVGINTSTPQNTLNVDGDANITGTIYMNEQTVLTSASGSEVDPLWSANYTAYNDSWTTTDSEIWGVVANDTFVPYTGSNANVVLGAYNFSVDSTDLFVDSNLGRVGIGTSSPSSILHIKKSGAQFGTIEVTDGNYVGWTALANAGTSATIRAYDGTTVHESLQGRGAFAGSNKGASIVASNATGADIRFYIGGWDAGHRKMTIANDGNVGIGDSTPDAKLDVEGDGSNVMIGGDLYVGQGSGADIDIIYFDVGTEMFYWDNAQFYISDDFLVGATLAYSTSGGAYANAVCTSAAGTGAFGSCSGSRKYKGNITYLESQDYSDVLEKIAESPIVTYNSLTSEPANRTRFGLIAEEAPADIRIIDEFGNPSLDHLSMDAYMWAGISALKKENNMLKSELCLKDLTYSWC